MTAVLPRRYDYDRFLRFSGHADDKDLAGAGDLPALVLSAVLAETTVPSSSTTVSSPVRTRRVTQWSPIALHDPLDTLEGQEGVFARAAVAAVRGAFQTFADKPGSEFYAAPGVTAEDTWERVTEEVARVSVLAAIAGLRDEPLTTGDVERIHRAIFEPVFGAASARFGSHHEDLSYPVVLGTRGAPVVRQRRGSKSTQIRRTLERAVRDFERELGQLASEDARGEASLRDAVRAALRLYVRVIRVHPFLDGNGRAAWAVFSYAAMRCGLTLVVLRPTDETRWALGTAIRSDSKQDYGPWADIIVETIQRSAA